MSSVPVVPARVFGEEEFRRYFSGKLTELIGADLKVINKLTNYAFDQYEKLRHIVVHCIMDKIEQVRQNQTNAQHGNNQSNNKKNK